MLSSGSVQILVCFIVTNKRFITTYKGWIKIIIDCKFLIEEMIIFYFCIKLQNRNKENLCAPATDQPHLEEK